MDLTQIRDIIIQIRFNPDVFGIDDALSMVQHIHSAVAKILASADYITTAKTRR